MNDVCMVCGKARFDSEYEVCPVCGCWNDFIFDDEIGAWISGANSVRLDEARKLYKAGRLDKLVTGAMYNEGDLHYDEKDGLKRAMYGLTLAERRFLGGLMPDINCRGSEQSDEELMTIYNTLKSYRTDDKESDAMRNGIVERFERFM